MPPHPRTPGTPPRALLALYRTAERRLRINVRVAIERGALGTAAYRQRQLAQIRAIIASTEARAAPLVPQVAIHAYFAGALAVDRVLNFDTAFGTIHQRAVAVIAEQLAGRLSGATAMVGRQVEDVFRRAGLEEAGQQIAQGETRRAASATMRQRLIDEGMTGFIDRRGARWSLETYTRMAIRTTVREAVSEGTVRRLTENGQDLITISEHASSCEICLPYEGNTYSLSGDSADYDAIDQLPPFHPNCLHVATPASANLDEFEAALGISG